jgi:4-amino-4-deoxy-L-arabinose transferase-like glycosyltransferase
VAAEALRPPESGTRPPRYAFALTLVCGLGLALRAAVVAWVPTQPASDFWVYFQAALELRDHGSYSEVWFPPAYPLVLAGPMALFSAASPLLVAKSVNLALATLAIALTALLARALGGNRAGLLAAAIVAAYPRSLLEPCLIASENLFEPLLLGFALLALAASRRSSSAFGLAAAAGVVVGLLSLTRPVAYLLGGLWMLTALRDGPRRWAAIRLVSLEVAVLVLVQHAVMLPWAMHNKARHDHFAFLTPVGGVDMFLGGIPDVYSGKVSWGEALQAMEPSSAQVTSQFDRDALARRAVIRYALEHPVEWLRLYGDKLVEFFRGESAILMWTVSAAGYEPPSPPIEVLPGSHLLKARLEQATLTVDRATQAVFALGLLGLLVFGAVVRERRRSRAVWLVAGVAIYFPLVTAVFHASDRYRWPVEDMLVPLGAMAILFLGSLAWAAVASALITVGPRSKGSAGPAAR